jgi:hypothetical protein
MKRRSLREEPMRRQAHGDAGALTPFDSDGGTYENPEDAEARALFAASDEKFREAASDNRRSDYFMLMTVLFAGALFLTGVSANVRGGEALAVRALSVGSLLLVGTVVATLAREFS